MGRRAPDVLPILSPGRHRRPRRGACLMEYTSLLAGERFSDSPACTDPVLAALARAVNDYTGDVAPQPLPPLAGALPPAAPARHRRAQHRLPPPPLPPPPCPRGAPRRRRLSPP